MIVVTLTPVHDRETSPSGTDDVVEILEYLVERNPELLSSRDQDGSLPLHVACRHGASFTSVQFLVNRVKASVKSVSSQGDCSCSWLVRPACNVSGHYLHLDEALPRCDLPMKPRESIRG
jgi:ankyrin repeat protein